MQAYQSPPCPYCGATWNQPGAQACANCRNPLPPPQPTYAPPGYPQGQQPPQVYGAPNYPPQAYPPQPQYPGPPPGYPGQTGYPAYGPPGYPQQPGAYGPDPGYAPYPAQGQPVAAAGTTFQLFGQTVTLPVALPPVLLQYQERIARGATRLGFGLVAVLVLLVLFVGVIPAVASGQTSSANQTLKTVASHQGKVDAVFTQALTLRASPADPTAAKAQFDKLAKSFNDGVTLVQSDEAALTSIDQRLTVLQWVTPSKSASIAEARHRVAAALNGLKQANQAKDAAGIKKYTDARNAALTAMGSPAETLPADYELKTFGPIQKVYDAAMKAIKSAS